MFKKPIMTQKNIERMPRFWDKNILKRKRTMSTSKEKKSIGKAVTFSKKLPSHCSICKIQFDRSRKRFLIASCGHERCYSCKLRSNVCSLCKHEGSISLKVNQTSHQRISRKVNYLYQPSPSVPEMSPPVTQSLTLQNNKQLTDSHQNEDKMVGNSQESDVISRNMIMMEVDNILPRRQKQINDHTGLKRQLFFYQSEPSQEVDKQNQLSLTRRRHTKLKKSNSRHSVNSGGSSSSRMTTSTDFSLILPQEGYLAQKHGHKPGFLKPLYFEVPCSLPCPIVGRQWLFMEISNHFNSNLPVCARRGVIITGGPGSGKTSIILSLVEKSCFGKKITSTGKDPTKSSEIKLDKVVNTSNNHMSQLANCVVAYHFCQADNSPTCLIPEFIQSIAAQMSQAPQLTAYFNLIRTDQDIKDKLSPSNCNASPSDAFTCGILEPLLLLGREGKINQAEECVIVVDALCEAEQHRPDFGDTLGSFLGKHLDQFPSWLKIIVTLRTASNEVTKNMPFQSVCLDNTSVDERPNKDISEYISKRVNDPDSQILPNISHNKIGEANIVNKLVSYLITKAQGCFLYVKLILDQLHMGNLVIKSGTFKILPRNLSEVYLLAFNKIFPTSQSYEQVKDILSISLASLQPVNLPELYNILSSLTINVDIEWDKFKERYLSISDILVMRKDGSVMLFHPTLRDWLLCGRSEESHRFKCELRTGHATIALYLARLSKTLMKGRTVDLVHHTLKANLLKKTCIRLGPPIETELSHKDIQALFVSLSLYDISAVLGSTKNIFTPIIRVSQVLLLGGADPNYVTDYMDQCPLLGIYSHFGNIEMVSLLLEFSVEVDKPNQRGETALSLSCKAGHMDIVELLLQCGAVINTINLVDQTCPLVLAAQSGHVHVVEHLLAKDWPKVEMSDNLDVPDLIGLNDAVLQAVNVAICHKQFNVSEILLDLPFININSCDSLSGLTPLCAAAKSGDRTGLELILKRKPTLSQWDVNQQASIHIGAREGHWDIVVCLLQVGIDVNQIDGRGRTPLMLAAGSGHSGIVNLLILHEAHLEVEDKEGITSLNHAVIGEYQESVGFLLNKGANPNLVDKFGRTTLDLAVFLGNEEIVELLLDNGADFEKTDQRGIRMLDRVIGMNNAAVVALFLRKGAKLGLSTWRMAERKPGIQLLLFNKLLDDGNSYYRKAQIPEAAQRYRYALKHMSCNTEPGKSLHCQTFSQLQLHLLLNLSRCERRLGRYEDAIKLANQALAVQQGLQKDDAGIVDSLVARAKAFRSSGQTQEASNDFYHALTLSPGNKEISRAIAKLGVKGNKENQLLKLPDKEKLCDIYCSVESVYFADGKSRDAGSI